MKAQGYGGRGGGDTGYLDANVLDGLLSENKTGVKVIDHLAHMTNTVRDELARQCAAHGIGKEEAGFLLAGGFAPVMSEGQQITGFSPCVFVTISLRSSLVPFKPVAAGLPAYGVLPEDTALREVVKRLVSEVDKARRDELRTTEAAA